MARHAAALRLVDNRAETPAGDSSLTEEAMAQWKEGQRRCRARKRHNWGPFTAYEHRSYLDVVEQCSHCRNRRSAEFVKTPRGVRKVTPWKPIYRDGYLLPRGAARLDEDQQDELTATDIYSRKVIEVPDEEDEE